MRSATIAATLMAMASAVTAQTAGFAVFANPAEDEVVFAGKPYTLKWAAGKDRAGPAILSLIGGETQGTQQPIGNLATLDVSANTYTWNVDCSLGKAKVYGLTITMVNEPTTFQWSQRFHIDNSGCPQGGAPAPASSSSSAAASSSSAAATGYPTISAPVSSSTQAVTSSSQSSAAPTVSSSVVPTLTKSQSQSAAPTVSSSATKPAATASQSTTGTAPIPTAAAPKVAAGSFALAGAVVAAVLAI